MKLTGEPFLLDATQKNKNLTQAEHEGLCALLDRCKRFGGTGDVLFLCLSTCSLLVRFHSDEQQHWQAHGFIFQKKVESYIWIYLPVLVGTVLTPYKNQPLKFPINSAAQSEQWFYRQDCALFAAARQFKHDSEQQLHPYSIGFTHIDPSFYGDDGIIWYPILSESQSPEYIETIPAVSGENNDCDAYLVPPKLLRGWRILQDENKIKLDAIDQATDWYSLWEQMQQAIQQIKKD